MLITHAKEIFIHKIKHFQLFLYCHDTMDNKVKILVSGDVNGNFKQLFNRVESINKKSGPFEILFCVGEFFGTNNDELIAYKNGNKNVPVPTYILGPNKEETSQFYNENESGEICNNLTYLGKRGIYTLSSRVKIAYLSGVEGTEKREFFFDKDDALALKSLSLVSRGSSSDYRGVDILLTSQWPQGAMNENVSSSKLISYLVKNIRPRYHFCGLNGKYFEPPPYRISSDNTTQLELSTRLIALAKVGNLDKQKYIYALSMVPVEKMRVMDLIQKTVNELQCPFESIEFSDIQTRSEQSSGKQYFYDLNTSKTDDHNRRRKGFGDDNHAKKRQRMTFDQEKCWFCLSSADVEKHLVVTIGENFYLALAKGPLTDTHVLILSVTHIQSASLLSKDDWDELQNFKNSLRNFYAKQGQVVVFFERNYKSSHLQINAVGVDEGYAWKIHHSFEDKAEEYNLTFETIPKLKEPTDLPQKGPYFAVEFPDNKTLITRQMKQFPLHFAREVFCSENLLNCDEKIDWKECSLPKDEEISLVKRFRELYKPFDFTL